MSNQCEQIRQEYRGLKALKQEFDLAYTEAAVTRDLAKTKELKAELEQKIEALKNKVWPFEALPRKELKEQYEKAVSGYHEFGWLKTLTSGQEGIIGENEQEYPVPSFREIQKALLANQEFFAEKFAVMENPRIHLTPFALSPRAMADGYGRQIENHFVEEKVEAGTRIPDRGKTKLFGVDGQPLELGANKQNVFFSDSLDNLSYFPKWQEKVGQFGNRSVEASGGLTKEEAITKLGGWQVVIIEDIPLAPIKGQGKTMEKEIKIKGKTKKVKRTQVAGDPNVIKQYELLKRQNETGLTPEDWLSFAMLHLKEKNIVSDDDQGTNYYCCLPGAVTAMGYAPYAGWCRRHGRQAYLDDTRDPGISSGRVVRGAVRVL